MGTFYHLIVLLLLGVVHGTGDWSCGCRHPGSCPEGSQGSKSCVWRVGAHHYHKGTPIYLHIKCLFPTQRCPSFLTLISANFSKVFPKKWWLKYTWINKSIEIHMVTISLKSVRLLLASKYVDLLDFHQRQKRMRFSD